MGDLAEMSGEDCPCGRHLPFLRGLEGRVSESIHLRDGRRISSAAFLGQFRHVLLSVHRAQAVALEPGRMCWRIVPGRGADPAALSAALLEKCAQVFGPALEATVEFVEDIPLAPSGKYEAVKSSNVRRATS
jgi:phenylacetate-CoA ligase